MTAEKKELINTTFDGEIVVLTGKLELFTRKEAEQAVEARGGKCTSSVTKKSDPRRRRCRSGQQVRKAQQLGTPIISEAEFKEWLER